MVKLKCVTKNRSKFWNAYQGDKLIAVISIAKNRGGQSTYVIDKIPGKFATLEKCQEAIKKNFPNEGF